MDVEHAPELVGNGVRLRELRASDIARRASLGRNHEIARGFGEDLDCDELFVGIVRLAPINIANRSARLGIGILDPARLGQGLGVAAIRLALADGFEHLDLYRVSLTVLADNTRAVAAYTRCGFTVEGRLRHTLWPDLPTIARIERNLRYRFWASQHNVQRPD